MFLNNLAIFLSAKSAESAGAKSIRIMIDSVTIGVFFAKSA
jgi:hypothetical protein